MPLMAITDTGYAFDLYEGEITVSDSPILSGSRFTVTLPSARK